jgi:hypothetical protein
MPRQLEVLRDLASVLDERSEQGGEAPLPEKSQCLYVEPLPNGERKNCKNCALWVTTSRCLIHDPTIHIPGDWICGYWVGGRPLDSDLHLDIKQYIPPSFTGLGVAIDGTACDNCMWYEAESKERGKCHALQEHSKPASVLARACCSRWQQPTRGPSSAGSR